MVSFAPGKLSKGCESNDAFPANNKKELAPKTCHGSAPSRGGRHIRLIEQLLWMMWQLRTPESREIRSRLKQDQSRTRM